MIADDKSETQRLKMNVLNTPLKIERNEDAHIMFVEINAPCAWVPAYKGKGDLLHGNRKSGIIVGRITNCLTNIISFHRRL